MKNNRFNKYLFVLLASVLAFTACGGSKQIAVERAANKQITILAVNDMHAAVDNFPRFAFMVDSLRGLYPDLLLVSAGDNQTGNPVNDQYPEKGLPMIELMNALSFDLSAIGNHEFDSSAEGLSNLLGKANFDFICANVMVPSIEKFPIKPYKIITNKDGVKVAFLSILDINQGGIPDSHPDNVREFRFADPSETTLEYLHLRDSADLFVLLSHYGFENDVELANNLPSNVIDLVIGGHSHTKVDKDQIHNNILITQADRKLKYATLLKLSVEPNGKLNRSMQLLTVGDKGNENEIFRAMVDNYNDNPALKVRIAEALDDFNSYEELGYLMVDALRESAKTDIAIINPGGVRIDFLPKGDVNTRDIYELDPFGNEMVVFQLTGHELRNLMLNGFELDERLPIYPSGIKSKYFIAADGSLKNIELYTTENEPLNMDKTYSVSMNDYAASVYDYEHNDPGTGLFRPTAESLIDYLKELKTIPSYRGEKRVEITK
ncbi:MAG: bifunctional metallophosphatase/5'-nucleotidase [Bacteroidales bacterium]|nr:bifunctional metallophosphatase/5'-nucleotidase [Bacteroidales bacterium]